MSEATETAACAVCGEVYPISEMGGFCGKLLCPRCLICSCCGSRVARSEAAACGDDRIEICQSCFDERFTRCDVCGLLLQQSDAHWRFRGGYERPYCGRCLRKVWGGAPDRSINHLQLL